MNARKYKATLCLGSNVPDGHDRIRRALGALIEEGWSPIECSDIYPSSSGYLNQIVVADICNDYDAAVAGTKFVERRLGRRPQHKDQGVVPVDIDIVLWDGAVMRPLDYESDYFKQGLEKL